MRAYTQRIPLVILALSLGLNVAAILLALKIFSWDAQLETLEYAKSRGMRLRWTLMDGTTIERLPSVFEVARGARPLDIRIEKTRLDDSLGSLKEAAQILSAFGTIKEISLEDAPEQVVETLLANLGTQPRLTGLYSYSAQFPERSTLHLRNFPELKNLAIVGAHISGEQFPLLPALENCDLSHSDISPAGLQRVLACPSLRELMVQEPDDGSEALRQAYFTAEGTHPRVRFRGIE